MKPFSLAIGDTIEVVVKKQYQVLLDTTGTIDVPTYEVWDGMCGKYRVIYNDPDNGWRIIHGEMKEAYFRKMTDRKLRATADGREICMRRKVFQKSGVRYVRNGTYAIDEILPLLRPELYKNSKNNKYIRIDGVDVKIASQRYMVFKKSTRCYKCGLEGRFFASEKDINGMGSRYHFNLYGINKFGHEILFTRDHIIPLSKGGSKSLANQETCCFTCNVVKADDMPGNDSTIISESKDALQP